MYVGVVENIRSSYNVQEILDKEVFFTIGSTPLGANLCLLEDRVNGVVEELLSNEAEWVKLRFSKVKKMESCHGG